MMVIGDLSHVNPFCMHLVRTIHKARLTYKLSSPLNVEQFLSSCSVTLMENRFRYNDAKRLAREMLKIA